MTAFWSNWIAILVTVNVAIILWLLIWTRKQGPEDVADTESCGHNYDGIEELNQPLPRWWLYLFYLTIIFGAAYLVLYPGMGKFQGLLNWSSAKQWQEEVEMAKNYYAPIFEQYAVLPIEELIQHEEPLKVGQRLFANNCATCHGSDAKGSIGFPNLTDNDWLYGGDAETIKTSILKGRSGVMPPMASALGDEGLDQVTDYLLSLSNQKVDAASALAGQQKFQQYCAGCHGQDAAGGPFVGAPNLSDDIWLYGGSAETIRATIAQGRSGNLMPAHEEILGPEKVHVIAAYVYNLSRDAR